MTDPLIFPTSSARFGLPLLFAGQSQKEFYHNEAIVLTDILLQASVNGEANDPPADPVEGECWLIGTQPTGDWGDGAGGIASWQNGQWIQVPPRAGMRVFDQQAGCVRRYDQAWVTPDPVSAPTGGATIDVEARNAILALIGALVTAGVIGGALTS